MIYKSSDIRMTEWLNKKDQEDNKIEKLNNNHLEVKKGKIHHISKQKSMVKKVMIHI